MLTRLPAYSAINSDTPALRTLCDRYHAWLHVDAAFGAFAILHPDFEPYKAHLSLGDSITSDAHKCTPALPVLSCQPLTTFFPHRAASSL
jgi:glutamate/tyrosine decarboxylase-like PLP-dependent enzyme